LDLMLRILRAFAWLRWRMLLNSLERTGARDTLERFSLAIEKLGPIMAGVLMIPSALVLAAGATAGGYALARGDRQSMLFEAARYLLLLVPIFSIIGPLLMPAADRTNPVRLLLLPIPSRTLYAAQASAAFADVWVLLMLPIVMFVPIGLVAGGAFAGALVAALGGVLLLAVVIGISALTTSLLHLAVRDRRRGELLTLLFIVVIPAIGMIPGLLHGSRHRARLDGQADVRTTRMPVWAATAASWTKASYPSELYVNATRSAANAGAGGSAQRLGGLAATAVALHGVGMFVFGRVLASPGSNRTRRQAGPMSERWRRSLPGLSSGASAVALAQVRLALRTPRGRAILLSPVVTVGVFGALMSRQAGPMGFGSMSFGGGLPLAIFGSFASLISILPIAMNQFAVDKAGLTRALLSPLADGEYLAGKAVGNGLIALAPALLCVLLSFALFPGGSFALWMSVPLALVATYLLVAPAAAAFSAMFPRVVDLNSIGRSSNAHGLAGLLGLIAFVAAAAPGIALALIASRWLRQATLVPVLLLGWCVIAYGIGRLVFRPVLRIFASRRDNLALIQ
jgi:hypothetical protein